MDKTSRTSIEMNDENCRPAMTDRDADVAGADIVYIGFPVWWYREPSIIDSFLDAYDFKGKKVALFATSGSSGLGNTAARIEALSGAEVIGGERFKADVSADELKAWADSL